jgi:O-antigen/teichoic acid export membrane protein
MSLARGSAKTLLLRIITLGIQVPTSILLARLLGVEGKGAYTLLTVVPWLITFVMLGGLDTAQAYLLSGGKARLSSVVKLCVLCVLAITPLAVWVYLRLVAPQVMASLPEYLVLLSCILVPLVLCRYFVLSILLGFEKVIKFNLIYLYTSLAVLLLVVVLVAGLGYGLYGALSGFIAAQTLVIPLGVFWIRRISRTETRARGGKLLKGWSFLKKSLSYGLKGHPAGVLATFNQRFDIFLLGALAGPAQVGLYAVAVAVAETIWHVPMSVHLNLFPRVAALGAEEGARRLPRACRMTFLLSASLALALLVFGYMAIGVLYGSSFLPAFPALAVLLPGVLAVSVSNVFESFFAGIDRRHYQSIAVGCAFVLSLGLGLWLIPIYGALGAAIASTASYFVQMAISLLLFTKIKPIRWAEYFVPLRADIKDLYRSLRSISEPGDRS